MPAPVSIVIPNWNVASLLERFLPAVVDELERCPAGSECIVVDDGSSDNSIALLREHFPRVVIAARARNRGFSSSANSGIEHARNERVVLLNNDIAVTPGFIAELDSVFSASDDVFAVSAYQRTVLADGTLVDDGFHGLFYQGGELRIQHATQDVLRGAPYRMGFADGGCSMYSRQKLVRLGGFCTALDPFYWEDVEISISALKSGWTIGFVPSSKVTHYRMSSTTKHPWKSYAVPLRNNILVHWLTLDSTAAWAPHLRRLIAKFFAKIVSGRPRYPLAVLMAALKFPEILAWRRRRAVSAVLSFDQVMLDRDRSWTS
ncbi:MAG: glycosyltransferase family 2 protein [Chthoniobacterales bacterium]